VTGEWCSGTPASQDERPTFDTSVAHVARVYDYWLGGKDNFAADVQAGDQAIAAYPDIVFSVQANRAFLARTVRYLAGARPGYASSSTSAPAFRRRITRTRWPSL
jgi:S-adenosyl methyltransferase